MAKVIFLLGLAGSGKSFHAEQLKIKEIGAEFIEGVYGDDNKERKEKLIKDLKANKICIVEEIAYCIPKNRKEIESHIKSKVPGVEIDYLCLENDLESANWNVQNRTNKGDIPGHLYSNQQYYSLYEYPEKVDPVPIKRLPQKKT